MHGFKLQTNGLLKRKSKEELAVHSDKRCVCGLIRIIGIILAFCSNVLQFVGC